MGTAVIEDRGLEEWKEARSVLGAFDNNLHDLRKYGFSFVTALLAASGLLSQGSSGYVPPVKATILVATLGLIVALRLLDKHYRLFQEAAAVRARLLESRLNLDLTDDIGVYYSLQAFWKYIQLLYLAFVSLTFLVGVAVLWGNPSLILALLASSLASGVLVLIIDLEKSSALSDWSVDNKIVSKGVPVRITFTNLNPANARDLKRPDQGVRGKFKVSWSVEREEEPGVAIDPGVKGQTADLFYFEDRDWLWKTDGDKVTAGLYRLTMTADLAEPKAHRTDRGRFRILKKTPFFPHEVTMTIQVN